jgi:hypothetical protein
MILAQRFNRLKHQNLPLGGLTVSANTLAQQTIAVPLPRTWPLEEIEINVTATMNSSAITTQITHGLLGLLRRIKLETNDGIKPATPVNVTGPGLLQLVSNEGLSLDRSTLGCLNALNQGFLIASGVYRVSYRVPLVHPMITGALRPRMLLPIHLHNEDPLLTLEFAAGTELITTAASWSSVIVEVKLVRREMPIEFAQFIAKNSPDGDPRRWFIQSDLIESVNAVSANQTDQELRVNVPTPGQYSSLQMYFLKGNANLTLASIDANATVNQETEWQLISGEVTQRAWRLKDLQIMNDHSRPAFPASIWNLNVPTLNAGKDQSTAAVNTAVNHSVASPQFGGALSTGYNVQDPYSVVLDFLSDGINDAEELGSLLDCNLPARQGLKMEIVGRVTTPANQASQANIVGRRFYGDLSRWQTVEKLG